MDVRPEATGTNFPRLATFDLAAFRRITFSRATLDSPLFLLCFLSSRYFRRSLLKVFPSPFFVAAFMVG